MKFDTYTRRARLYPVLLAALPLSLATLAWFPDGLTGWGVVWGLIVWSGGTALFVQIGRDWGRRKEPKLYAQWGGIPTTRMLRHRDASNKVILERRHNKLRQLLPDVKIPTPAEEQAQPAAADEVYESCVAFLREKTRDKKTFPLVFEENCNYGFRRNLWGLKPIGIAIAAIGTIAIVILVLVKGLSTPPPAIACGLLNILFLVGWLVVITPNWVKTTADAYAERLLASCENLLIIP